jgi:hypothetical protein
MSLVFTVKRSRNLGNMVESLKVKWDNALAAYSADIIIAMQLEIETPKWGKFESMRWLPSAYVSPSVDDIVESGTLRDSFFVNVLEGRYGSSYEVKSSANYVNAIRFGYMSKRSEYSKAKDDNFMEREIPGRDFVRSALTAFPIQPYLKAWKAGGAGSISGTGLNFKSISSADLKRAPIDLDANASVYENDLSLLYEDY